MEFVFRKLFLNRKWELTSISLIYRYNPTPQALPVGVVAPSNYRSTVPYTATLNATIDAIEEINTISSPTHNLNITSSTPKQALVQFNTTQQALDRDLVIEIELQSNPENYVEVEETSPGKYTAMYAFVPHFKPRANVNSELIFVVDCSGSMTGKKCWTPNEPCAFFYGSSQTARISIFTVSAAISDRSSPRAWCTTQGPSPKPGTIPTSRTRRMEARRSYHHSEQYSANRPNLDLVGKSLC